MICAVYESHTKIVELLLNKEGIDINYKDIQILKIFITFTSYLFHSIENLNDLWNSNNHH